MPTADSEVSLFPFLLLACSGEAVELIFWSLLNTHFGRSLLAVRTFLIGMSSVSASVTRELESICQTIIPK